MAACPNCGRQTLRTKDWACQWCGYPLISRAYKKIDKTFKELQEERNLGPRPPETEDIIERKAEPAPEPETPPSYQFRRRPEPAPPPRPQPEEQKRRPEPMKANPPAAPIFTPRAETIQEIARAQNAPPELPRYEPPPAPLQTVPPLPQPPVNPVAETAPAPPMITPPPQVHPPATPEPVMPEPKAEVRPAAEPVMSVNMIQEGTEISSEQLDTIFQTEKSAAHTKLTGKTIIIRGTVEKVFIREHLEIRYVILTGARKKAVWSQRCEFNREDAPKAARLNEGQEARVRAKYDGYSKNIIFKDCAVI